MCQVLDHGGSGGSRDMLGSVWEFPRNRLRLQTVLGEGNFGKVWKAEADEICGYDGTILVAVKTVKVGPHQHHNHMTYSPINLQLFKQKSIFGQFFTLGSSSGLGIVRKYFLKFENPFRNAHFTSVSESGLIYSEK